MKRLISIIAIAISFAGCTPPNEANAPKPITETKDFAYVSTPSGDISTLNQWLRANPSKKVVSFSGVLAYRDGVSGYVVYFTSGDNSQQKFESVSKRIVSLQEWKDAHPDVRVVAISTVPAYSGGVREYTICYE